MQIIHIIIWPCGLRVCEISLNLSTDICYQFLLPLLANIYKIIPTHKLSVFICWQILSKSNYPYLNVRKHFPKVIVHNFRVRRKFFRVRPCLLLVGYSTKDLACMITVKTTLCYSNRLNLTG